MSTPSAIPAVIDALVTKFQAILPAEAVFDGPGVGPDVPTDYVMVGVSDPDQEGWDEAASSQQSWAGMGHQHRDEVIIVHCSAVSWSGEINQKTVRDNAYVTFKTLTDAITADPSLSTGQLLWVTGGTQVLRQAQTSKGVIASVLFDVQVKTRLA